MSKTLLRSLDLGTLQVKNRVFLAPLTRTRADADHTPNELMAEYYAQRASGGLLIAEATAVSEGCSAFGADPGIYNDKQVEGWKKVTSAVHEAGGKIFLQLWHGGRACHPLLNDGQVPVAPSAIAIDDITHTPEGKKPYTVPRALELEEIPEIVTAFRTAAHRGKEAGFDGVEVHGANGYLLDEFLRESANQRTDHYGGSLENRARLLLEVIEAVASVMGSDRTGVRISPLNSYNSMKTEDPVGLVTYLAKELSSKKLAYLHLMRADFEEQQEGDVVTPAREHYDGNLVLNMGYTPEEAEKAVSLGQADAIAFGTSFLANPDLPERIAKDAPLNEPEPSTFYTSGPEGYTDYPAL